MANFLDRLNNRCGIAEIKNRAVKIETVELPDFCNDNSEFDSKFDLLYNFSVTLQSAE